jgi:DNA-binding transcriptional regulator YiaG
MINDNDLGRLLKELRETKIDFEKSKDEQGRKELKRTIAAKILAYRHKNKLTQEGLAKDLGVPKLEIVRWENEKNLPSRMALEKLRAAGIV